jgi:4-amino-4-deoxy-L-arabinose transferase-like glycosyltransferase
MELRRSAVPAIVALAWAAVIALAIYDFSNPDAVAWLRAGQEYYTDILRYMPRNIVALPETLLLLFSGFGAGDAVCSALRLEFRSKATRLSAALCLGLALLTFVVMAAGASQKLNSAILPVLLILGTLYSGVRLFTSRALWFARAQRAASLDTWSRSLGVAAAALLVVTLYFALLGALQPEIEYDAKVYHLTVAKRYVEHGGFYNAGRAEGLPSLDFPQYQEYLYTEGYRLFGMPGAKLLSWSMLLIATIGIIGFGAEIFGSTLAGLFAALLFAATPIVSWSAGTANTDLGQVPYFVLALYGVLRWRADRNATGWLLFAGILCGFAAGIKPFALVSAFVLAVVVAATVFRTRSIKPLLYFAVGAIAAALPGMVRAEVLTGDPLFPLAAGLFHSSMWTPALDELARSAYHLYGADTSWRIFAVFPWMLTTRVDQYRDVIGPLYVFAVPFFVYYVVRKNAHPALRLIAGILVLWCVLWFCSTAIEARYAEAIFPLVALAAAWIAVSADGRSLFGTAAQRLFALLLLAFTVLNMQPLVGFQRGAMLPYAMGTVRYQWDYLYGCEPESGVQLRYAPMLGWLNAHLDSRRDRVYTDTDDYLLNVYSNVELFAAASPWQKALNTWSLQSPDAYARLRALDIDYVLVPAGEEHALSGAPLWPHLTKVAQTAGLDPGATDVLYRLVETAS